MWFCVTCNHSFSPNWTKSQVNQDEVKKKDNFNIEHLQAGLCEAEVHMELVVAWPLVVLHIPQEAKTLV